MNENIELLFSKLDKAKTNQEYANIIKQINEEQDKCAHEFEVKGMYKTCVLCGFTDVYQPRKKKSKTVKELI